MAGKATPAGDEGLRGGAGAEDNGDTGLNSALGYISLNPVTTIKLLQIYAGASKGRIWPTFSYQGQ